jgi:Na+/H+ antiporter NhaD/arsenite permease-like protein
VATLFIGIFITMIPALAILGARGAELGLTKPFHFFWATGILSSFLDNAPTYLVFMTTAASLHASSGLVTTVGNNSTANADGRFLRSGILWVPTPISAMPPNFMVRSIAEENKIKMPSFFGYMGCPLRF